MKITSHSIRSICLIAVLLALPAQPFAWGQHPGAAAKPDRWEADIRKFEEQDRAAPSAPGGVLFVGSSSIRLWDLKKSFPEMQAINRGFGGSQVADVVQYADRIVFPYQPKLIVFYAGDNDLASSKSPETVAADFAGFVKTVHAELPATSIVFISIKPSVARWKLWDQARRANDLIKQQADEDERLKLLDIGPLLLGDDGMPNTDLFREDKLHLNDKGYERWAKALGPSLAEKARP
jgi:lysophospholipase L1-like esterase